MNKTRIETKLRRKTNPELVRTIISTKKKNAWEKISHIISGPRRKQIAMNLDEINAQSADGDNVLVPGKVLGEGNIDKKIRIIALDFSESAREKLEKAGVKMTYIQEEVEKNPEGKDLKIIFSEKIRQNKQ